jgi:hypothetical protein
MLHLKLKRRIRFGMRSAPIPSKQHLQGARGWNAAALIALSLVLHAPEIHSQQWQGGAADSSRGIPVSYTAQQDGFVTLVIEDGKGNRIKNAGPVSDDRRSKPVTAAGGLWLVEHGKLALDSDVNLELKSWKVPDNQFTAREKVTLRRLMSHNAGMNVHGFAGYVQGVHSDYTATRMALHHWGIALKTSCSKSSSSRRDEEQYFRAVTSSSTRRPGSNGNTL